MGKYRLFLAVSEGYCPMCSKKMEKGEYYKTTEYGHFHYKADESSIKSVEKLDSRGVFTFFKPLESPCAKIIDGKDLIPGEE